MFFLLVLCGTNRLWGPIWGPMRGISSNQTTGARPEVGGPSSDCDIKSSVIDGFEESGRISPVSMKPSSR
jgi:hypothetical protein